MALPIAPSPSALSPALLRNALGGGTDSDAPAEVSAPAALHSALLARETTTLTPCRASADSACASTSSAPSSCTAVSLGSAVRAKSRETPVSRERNVRSSNRITLPSASRWCAGSATMREECLLVVLMWQCDCVRAGHADVAAPPPFDLRS
eukprot:781503-Pleurochrysis_carterae.AAC.2